MQVSTDETYLHYSKLINYVICYMDYGELLEIKSTLGQSAALFPLKSTRIMFASRIHTIVHKLTNECRVLTKPYFVLHSLGIEDEFLIDSSMLNANETLQEFLFNIDDPTIVMIEYDYFRDPDYYPNRSNGDPGDVISKKITILNVLD